MTAALSKSPGVAVRCAARPACRCCRRLARQLGAGAVVVVGDEAVAAEFCVSPARMVLRARGLPGQALRFDFERARAGGGADPLLRAVGAARGVSVVDATAGWARDAWHLARAGCVVTAVEREPLVAALLAHAHARCRGVGVAARLRIVHADGAEFLARAAPPDVVYLDPMYPPTSKSAATKKPLAMLRLLTAAAADDGAALLAAALAAARRRVVVKRPHRAPPLAPGKVGETAGKLVRFDIYQPPPK